MSEDQTNEASSWARDWWPHFKSFAADLRHLATLILLAVSSISREPRLLDWFERYRAIERELHEAKPLEDDSNEEDRRRELAEFASTEIATGFPRLYSFGAIALCASLEAHVDNILVTWLMSRPDAWEVDEVARVRVSVSEFSKLSESERCLYVIEQLKREVRSSLREGISGFETLFDVFGLGGKVHEQTRKDIFELIHVRNVLLHKGGLADRRFCTACPWFGLKPGDQVKVDEESYHRYWSASLDYSYSVMGRVKRALGMPERPHTLREPDA